ncbi:MAG: S-layer homology domain-containing protein [Bacillota bacterium]|nr:S-layer homology domain-containing protein [Candidatus Fermentithermobacillaceae bacterium]
MAGGKKLTYRPSRSARLILRTALVLVLMFSILVGMSGFAEAKSKSQKQMAKMIEKLMKQAEKVLKQTHKLGFSDVGASFWALESILRMRGFGIISGYDGNVFKPNDPVKQAEALAMMVRAFGLEDEAEELAKRFGSIYLSIDQDIKKQDNKRLKNHWYYWKYENDDAPGWFYSNGSWYPYVPESARWSLGYILIAVDEGWVELDDLHPEKPATRAWVAKALVRASGNGKLAEAKMNAKLDFKDAKAIPDGYWGYVAQAVDMGLFKGYVDNTFQPNKPVTRAEMAAILDRLINEELPDEMPYYITGTVVDVSRNSIEIMVASGKVYEYPVSKDAVVFLEDSKQGSVSDIRVGDTVKVLTNPADVAVLITIVKRGTPAPIKTGEIVGTIVTKLTTSKGEVVITVKTDKGSETLTLDRDCTVTDGRYEYAASRLAAGDVIFGKLQNGKLYYIRILEDESTHLTGTIKAKQTSGSTRTLEIETDAGRKRSLTLHADVVIKYEGDTISFKDLAVGDVAAFVIVDNRVVYIQVIERLSEVRYVSGVVTRTRVSKDEMSIEVQDSSNKTHRITLASNVKVTYKGELVPRTQIQAGDKVRVKLAKDNGVEVEIVEKYDEAQETTGIIAEIKAGPTVRTRIITIKQDDCKQLVLTVGSATEIFRGTTKISADRLAAGDKVKVKHDGEEAVKIEVLATKQAIPFGDLYGKIETVTRYDYAAVLIVEYQGEKTLVIADSETKVSYNNRTLGWEDLRKGDVVRVALDGHTAVEIRIESRQ